MSVVDTDANGKGDGKSQPLSRHPTLVHALKHNVEQNADHVFIKWINDDCKVESTLTYQQLWDRSGLVVNLLSMHGVHRGDRVMVAYKFGLDFLSGLFGCMRYGVIACSVYPPNFVDKSKMKHSYEQFNTQVEDAGANFALTTTDFKRGLLVAGIIHGRKTGVQWLATDRLSERPTHSTSERQEIAISSDDTAFVQYSSGSTGAPKGVIISHRAIVHNIHCLKVDSEIQDGSVGVCWMPQYHDFALVGCYLMCFFVKATLIAFSPISFIRNPILWADILDKFEGTHTGGPNFSFALLAKRLKAANRKLSNTTLIRASIGGEPIAPKTLQDMQDIGIKKAAINPCYGMAETCLRVTLAVGDEVQVVDGVVSVGYLPRDAAFGRETRVANPEGRIVEDGEVGEIFVRGPDLALGYWNKPDLDSRFHTELSDGEEYLSTGDLGMIVENRLYIVGRCKELIIVNGRNIYPTDIERLIESDHPDIIRPGSAVAFQRSGNEVGLAFEIRKTVDSLKSVSETFSVNSLRSLVSESAGVGVGQIVALKQGAVPKTTSGKLRRVDCRRRSLEGAWDNRDVLQSWALTDKDDTETVVDDSNEKTSGRRLDTKETEDVVQSLFAAILGADFDPTSAWKELSLTSVAHAELSGLVEEKLQVKLPSNFHELYPTPNELRTFIKEQAGERFPVELLPLPQDDGHRLTVAMSRFIQGIGICLLLTGLMVPFSSAFAVGSLGPSIVSFEDIGRSSKTWGFWVWPALVLPTFVLSFSLLVVAAKWLVIGRYRAEQLEVYSFKYVRWWLIDRLVHLWEVWVGVLIVDTPFILFFYRLLGCNIHPRSEIKAFIREFDLVSVGSDTTIKQQIRCRRFGPWEEDSGPTLRFRRVNIGSRCVIEGLVGLGSDIGDCVHLDKMSVLPEGARVSPRSYVCGNPAFDSGREYQGNLRVSSLFILLQVLWLILEVYVVVWLFLVSKLIWIGLLTTSSWRYKDLMYWILSLLTTSFLALIFSAGLKWTMIGRRSDRVGTTPSVWVSFTDWACDYHYIASSSVLYTASGISRVWNVILILHGLNIDLKSALSDIYAVSPSVIDQLFVRRSFIGPWVTFQSGERIEIMDSTIGTHAVVHSGVKVHRSTIRAFVEINQSVYDENTRPTKVTLGRLLTTEAVGLLYFALLFGSFIPAFELYVASSSGGGGTVGAVVVATVTQFVSWWLFAYLSQTIALLLLKVRSVIPFVAESWYHLYIQVVWFNNSWGHWFLLWGTPFYNGLARSMGATVKGDFFFNGMGQHDFWALVFEDKTVVDDSHLIGHIQVGTELIVKPSIHCGVLHEGCFTLAGTCMEGTHMTETGPLRAILGQINKSVLHSPPHEVSDGFDSLKECAHKA